MQTWIKLYRQLKDHEIMRDSIAVHIFMWILISVDYKTGKMISGRFWASSLLGIKPITYYKVLKRLAKKYDLVTLSSNNKNTTILVKNWNKYQGDNNTSSNNKVTTKEQQSNTNQEIKNKEDKKEREAISFLETFNGIRKTNYKTTDQWIKNFIYWREHYTLEEIGKAVGMAKHDRFMDSAMTPTWLFRTRNKNGECDYIGDLLNIKTKLAKELDKVEVI